MIQERRRRWQLAQEKAAIVAGRIQASQQIQVNLAVISGYGYASSFLRVLLEVHSLGLHQVIRHLHEIIVVFVCVVGLSVSVSINSGLLSHCAQLMPFGRIVFKDLHLRIL